MKKFTLIALLMAATLWSARALDWSYSTNQFYDLAYPTNIYMGTNAYDGATNGDTFYQWGTKMNGFMLLYNRNYINPTNNQAIGGVGLTNGSISLSNFVFKAPRWVDSLASGLTLAGGTAAPERADVPGTWSTAAQAYRYGHNDYASFAIQSWHVMATTNSAFPQFYYEPHIHISVANTNAGTNATFVMEWQSSIVEGVYSDPLIRTNTIGFVGTNTHTILSFGEVTNNALNGRASVMFRGTVKRIASASNDVGSGSAPNQTQKVFIDSLDFHIPVRVLGSTDQYSGE